MNASPPSDTGAPSGSWRLAVLAVPDDQSALKQILLSEFDLTPIDAQVQIHGLPGLLPDRMDRTQGERLRQRIEELGVATALVEASSLPDLDHAHTLHHVRCLPEGLEILGLAAAPDGVLPWSQLSLISLGYVPLESARHYDTRSVTVVASGPHSGAGSSERTVLSGPELWLLVEHKTPIVYRVDHNLMNYEYLGDRKSDSATANFRLFVEDLVEFAATAYQTPATRAFVAHGLLRHYAFHSSEELRHHTLFHFLLRRRMHSR